MAFGKRQLVLAALVVALGAAVYLNWQFSDNRDLLATNTVTSSQKELGEAQYVNNSVSGGDVSSGSDSSDTSSIQDDVSSGVSSSASGYFANARLTREKSRDEAADLIKDILQGVDASDDAKRKRLTRRRLSLRIWSRKIMWRISSKLKALRTVSRLSRTANAA